MTIPLADLTERIVTASGPGNVLDNLIAEYLNDGHYLSPDEIDEPTAYTTDKGVALDLVTKLVPGLAVMLLKHPNGLWSLAWSDDGVPQLDGSMFKEEYLALSLVAMTFETLVERAARQQ